MSIKEQFKQTEKLYHFTSFDTALRILDSNRLKFGRLNNMNDIHENDKLMFADANGRRMCEFPSETLDALYSEIYRYRQISLTTDCNKEDKDGFDLHQMWGLYAEKGEGVCLVFDKNELEKNYDMVNIYSERVNYTDTQECASYIVTLSLKPESVSNEVQSQISKIFFHKRKEWEHEQEYRLIKRCANTTKEEYLLLGHALKFVILSSKLRSIDEVRYFRNIATIKEMVKKIEKERNAESAEEIPVLIYGNGFFNYSLVTSNHDKTIWDSNSGYDTMETEKVKTTYTREQLLKFSNGEFLDKTDGKALDFHLTDGRMTQLCAGDILGIANDNLSLHTRTGLLIRFQDVDYVEVIE